MLNDIKLILGIAHDYFDTQLQMFIDAGKKDLEMAGIVQSKIVETDPLILSMMDTYEYRELSANAYALQKDQLRHYQEYLGV